MARSGQHDDFGIRDVAAEAAGGGMRFVLWLACALLAACASENLYEGFKAREAARDPVAGQNVRSALPSHPDYEAERARLLNQR